MKGELDRLRRHVDQLIAANKKARRDRDHLEKRVADLEAELASLPSTEDLNNARQRIHALLERLNHNSDPATGRGN
jgi:phage shock protein A